jgi:sialate O-acetylesterase
MKKLILCAGMFLSCGLAGQGADLRFSQHYSDNMVLQREKPVLVRGFADKGAEVTVTFADQTKKTKADGDGSWSVRLEPLSANRKGSELKAAVNGQAVKLTDVLVGDVFLFARQTTIDVSLGRDEAGRKAASRYSKNPQVRCLAIKTIPAIEPQSDLAADASSGWAVLDGKTALDMNAAAFYTVEDLAGETDVPIGVIDLNMGHHFPIAWLSKEALLETSTVFDASKTIVEGSIKSVDNMFQTMEKDLAVFNDAEKLKEAQAKRPDPIRHPREDARFPAAGYNAVLHPMQGLALKGILLQLGNDYPYYLYNRLVREGKATSRAHLDQVYEETYDLRKWGIYLEPITTPRIPSEWRKTFGDDSLAIGWITPPGSDLIATGRHHREMRELQRRTAEAEEGVDLIQAGTEHLPYSAQPADEALLAERCRAWLMGAVYKKDGVVFTGPLFDRAEMNYSKAQIFYKPGTAEGLKAEPGALEHFEVAGTEREYYPASAKLDGDTIRLSSDTVSQIMYIRYNWTEKPDQGLLNSAGLPAVPFMTAEHLYPRNIDTKGEEELPEEFSLPIPEWKNEGAVVLNNRMKTGLDDAKHFLGPTGLRVSPFGPNLYVNGAYIGSPADGKILSGDYLYGVNGKLFGDDMLKDIAEAITQAETEQGEGKISFDLMRNGNTMSVELQLEVLGTYSSTSPYNCPKTDRIVANAEEYLAKRGGVAQGAHPVWQNADAMFLLAAGTPEYQGLVRRHVYNRLAKRDLSRPVSPIPPTREERDAKKFPGGPWDLSADMLLISEYYLATGDRYVLPYLKDLCDSLTSIQIREQDEKGPWPEVQPGQTGGWRHNFYGGAGYGTMPAIGVPAALGYHLTKESGVEYDFKGYERAVKWFLHNGAQVGNIFYGYVAEEMTHGNYIDPDKLAAGKLWPGNGGVGGAAVLFDLMGNGPVARTCSLVATHTYNNTWGAHGGYFWLNFYTPLGVKVHGEKPFQFYMKGNRTWQELHRMFDHSREEDRNVFGAGQFLAYVAPKERLRILGAHESVFSPDAPDVLQPALEAYYKRDYASCEKAATALIENGELYGLDLQKTEQLRDAAVLIQESIALDLAKVKRLLAENKPYEASLDLEQLKAVMPEGNDELAAIEKQLSDPALKDALAKGEAEYTSYLKSLTLTMRPLEKPDEAEWQSLVAEESAAANRGKVKKSETVEPTVWRMKVLESIALAPEDWMDPEFDDSSWMETTMPVSWHMNHTALFRADFDVADKQDIKALRLRQYAFRQENMRIYINGKMVAIISAGGGPGGDNEFELSEHAIKSLRKGRNTIAATYQHCWRWGRYGSRVYNGGASLALDMRTKAH